MKRVISPVVLLVAAGACAMVLVSAGRTGASKGKPQGGADRSERKEPKPAQEPVRDPPSRPRSIRELQELLNMPVNAEFEQGGPLVDAVNYLQDRFGVSILVDEPAFREEGLKEGVLQTPVQLPKFKEVRLGTILGMLLGPVDGDYFVQQGHIMVVPKGRVRSGWFLQQPVDGTFADVPFTAVFDRLREQTGVSILLDPAAVNGLGGQVSVMFNRVPLETAVSTLANMADLKSVRLGNELYVTTQEKAVRLEPQRTRAEHTPAD